MRKFLLVSQAGLELYYTSQFGLFQTKLFVAKFLIDFGSCNREFVCTYSSPFFLLVFHSVSFVMQKIYSFHASFDSCGFNFSNVSSWYQYQKSPCLFLGFYILVHLCAYLLLCYCHSVLASCFVAQVETEICDNTSCFSFLTFISIKMYTVMGLTITYSFRWIMFHFTISGFIHFSTNYVILFLFITK